MRCDALQCNAMQCNAMQYNTIQNSNAKMQMIDELFHSLFILWTLLITSQLKMMKIRAFIFCIDGVIILPKHDEPSRIETYDQKQFIVTTSKHATKVIRQE
jgi:hypothetical protein